MRRICTRLRPTEGHWARGAETPRARGSSEFPVFDARLLAVIAVALITLAALLSREPAPNFAPTRIAQGEVGAQILGFAFSPKTAQIATTDAAGIVTLRDPDSGWQIDRCLDFPGFARALAFSPDGRFLAAGGIAPAVCLWDMTSPTSKPTETVVLPIARVKRMAFSPDDQSLVITADADGTILLWDLATRRARMVLHHSAPVMNMAVSPDGRWLATAGSGHNRLIVLWDLKSGSRHVLLDDGPGDTMALAFSPDGALLASAGFPEHEVRLWDVKKRRVCRLLAGHTRPVNGVAFSPDGTLLATAGNDGVLGLWTVASGQRRVWLDGQALCLKFVAFSPDGRTLVLATGDDDDIRIWDLVLVLGTPGTKRFM